MRKTTDPTAAGDLTTDRRGRGPIAPGRRRTALWVTFGLVHAWITVVGVFIVRGSSFHDVELYRYWVELVASGGPSAVLDTSWVYPAGALLPMLVASIGGAGSTVGYMLGWCAMVTALDAVAVVVLLRFGRQAGAWWWLGFLWLLGPVALGRLDAVVAPIAVIGLVLASRSPAHARAASALLTLGAWIKVAPGALLLPLFAARRRPLRDVVLPAAAVTLAVVVAVAASGSLDQITSFLTDQGDRGLQIEAVGASGWMFARLFTQRIVVFFNEPIATFEVTGPGTADIARLLDVALLVAVALIGVALMVARRRGVADLVLLPGALAVTAALLVTDKVGSPQYLTWLAAPIAVALSQARVPYEPRRAGIARGVLASWAALPLWLRASSAITLAAALLTQMVFPWGYRALLHGYVGMTLVLVVRNALLIALLVAALAGIRAVVRWDPDDARTTRRLPVSADPGHDLAGDQVEMLDVGQVEDLEVHPLRTDLGEST